MPVQIYLKHPKTKSTGGGGNAYPPRYFSTSQGKYYVSLTNRLFTHSSTKTNRSKSRISEFSSNKGYESLKSCYQSLATLRMAQRWFEVHLWNGLQNMCKEMTGKSFCKKDAGCWFIGPAWFLLSQEGIFTIHFFPFCKSSLLLVMTR